MCNDVCDGVMVSDGVCDGVCVCKFSSLFFVHLQHFVSLLPKDVPPINFEKVCDGVCVCEFGKHKTTYDVWT